MRYPSTRHAVVTALLGGLALLMPVRARGAEPTARQCLSANEQSIALREQNKLLAARESLLVCASTSCPDEIREECARRVDGVSASIPSVVFEAKDASGKDLGDVRVTMDGRLLAAQLRGLSMPLDPGEHTFVFEAGGLPVITRSIIVVEGVKDRREIIVFGTPPSSEPAPNRGGASTVRGESGTVQRVLGWTAMGVGAAGLGIGVAFALQRESKQSEADGICSTGTCPVPPGQTADQVTKDNNAKIHQLTSEANTAGTISTIGFVAGGAFVAGGLVLLLTAPSSREHVSFTPVLSTSFGGVTATGRFW